MKRRHPQLSEHYTARAHRGIAPRFPTLSADCPWTCPRDLWIWYPFFHIFLFSIPLTRYARYEPGGEKDTLFTRFYWRGWCTGPNETCPPPPPPGACRLHGNSNLQRALVKPLWGRGRDVSGMHHGIAAAACINAAREKAQQRNLLEPRVHSHSGC